jgi:hypothetical protein
MRRGYGGNMQPEIDFFEHAEVNGIAAKKVVILGEDGSQSIPGRLYGYDADTATWRPLQVVESTDSPGNYVLAVGNIDGSPITGGSSTPTDYGDYLLEDDTFLLLENTDNLLLQA